MTGHYAYEKKEDYPLPWIKCLWCNYKDKVERDLEWHFLDNHKYQLRHLGDEYYFLYNMDTLLAYAVERAKSNSNCNSTGTQESR